MRTFALLSLLSLPLAAQAPPDLIGISFTGEVVFFDSYSGAGFLDSQLGITGINAMARQGRSLRFVNRTGATIFQHQFHLNSMEPLQGNSFQITANIGLDPRGLAEHPTNPNELLAVLDGSPDQLVRYNVATQAITPIGPTGLTGIQSLATRQGIVWAFDATAGLVQLSLTTGAANDPFPLVGGQGIDIQFLTAHSDGRLLGGRQTLYDISTTTGVATAIGPIAGGAFDLRGAEERIGTGDAFGAGCNGANGGQVQLGVPIEPRVNQPFQSQSFPHTPGSIGVRMLGFSAIQASGVPLPVLLDPLLGTVNCNLYTSLDLLDVGIADATGRMTLTFPMPASAAFLVFYVQHVVLEAVPGGLSLSNGCQVRVEP